MKSLTGFVDPSSLPCLALGLRSSLAASERRAPLGPAWPLASSAASQSQAGAVQLAQRELQRVQVLQRPRHDVLREERVLGRVPRGVRRRRERHRGAGRPALVLQGARDEDGPRRRGAGETAEEVVACSVRGEDCARSRCCEETGYKCYEKNSSFSGCRTECKPGLYDPTGTDWKPWTCVLKSEANPLASQGKASGQGGSGAGRVFGVALAAIQEEVEEIDMKQMMART
ncbi:unnamed protein product [Prorocentrum cordatum]|uniref:Uncharacterized protein n=1 Tax=Prorocentrum cordatum TaxID=2364126 RepID=A0ABN9RYS3_9DINO|nr:unnamed protein product [Polarella glacialis]